MSGSKTKAVGGQPVNPVAQQYQSFLGNAMGQTGDASSAIHSMLQGGTAGITPQQLDELRNFSLPTINNNASSINMSLPGQTPLSAPTTQGTDYTNPGTMGVGSTANLADTSGFASWLAGLNIPNVTSASPDVNGKYATAITDTINNSISDQVAGLREGFAASGGGAGRGTPGAYGEAVLRSQAAPAIATALGNLNLNENSQNLQAAGLNLQGLAQMAGNINNAAGITNNSNALAVSNQQGNRQLDVNQILTSLGLNQTAAGQNQAAATTARGQDASYATSGIDQILQMFGLQSNQQQALNANDLAVQNANAANAATTQNNALNVANLGVNAASAHDANIMNILQQIFAGLNQTNQMGTTQAQTIQKPSGFQNFMSGVTGLAGAAAPIIAAV